MPEDPEIEAWAASGAMQLTGRPGRPPLGPPRGLVPKMQAIADRIEVESSRLARPVVLDPLALLGERAASAGFDRAGAVSCGGGTRLLPTDGGWMAVSLARPDDVDLVAAWLEWAPADANVWDDIGAAVRRLDPVQTHTLVDRAALLGLPVAILGEHPEADRLWEGLPVQATARPGTAVGLRSLRGVRVADLSSLWAGPLCGSILAEAGAEVIKVESTRRPDGARRGPRPFFDLLNGAKRSVAFNLTTPRGIAALRSLIDRCDVVIEASRPRALEQFGIDAGAALAGGRTRVWVSITGHGRAGSAGRRVAFGDDAAIAGGLASWDGDGPCFCADAIADPVTGLVAAAAVLQAVRSSEHLLLDVSMAGVAAHFAGPTVPSDGTGPVAPPRARPASRPAPPLGADTAAVLAALGQDPSD